MIAGDSFADAYEPARVRAFVTYISAGLLSLAVSLAVLRLFVRDSNLAPGRPSDRT